LHNEAFVFKINKHSTHFQCFIWTDRLFSLILMFKH